MKQHPAAWHRPPEKIDFVEGNTDRALAAIPERGHLRLLYRGWMLTGEEDEALDEALGELGHELMTTPAEYAAAHYLPNWYPRLKGLPRRRLSGSPGGQTVGRSSGGRVELAPAVRRR